MIALAALALLAGTPITAQVDVGKVDVKKLPELRRTPRELPSGMMIEEVEKILASGQCRIPGQTARSFDITIPYAVLVEPDGKAHRVVVNELGCAPLEAYAGAIVLELARQGDFRPTGKDKSSWYGSEINFNLDY